ncbi:MAG: phenylphosphate carboxylase subunit delta [Porticoccaceae bacterium]|nr:phenylphosphate carboxylase subunit delta [Porticoccaceae bacterium]MEA3300685.1 phenylphosphate carboxylase subunit delta [Pseudomonadota bacterium]HLS98700.1 phenylphosphate carboxylase subunit delta [Porticoccaceae bacterium]
MNPQDAARQIRLLLLDVDGVLTDGRLYYGNNGEELKAFHIQDGLGIKLLQRNGVRVGIITGRRSALLARRAAELGIDRVVQGREDKSRALDEWLAADPLPLHQIAFMGDDLPDLPVMARVGLALTVADCASTVAERAHWQARRGGGRGAVREAAEFILKAQGLFDGAIEDYR